MSTGANVHSSEAIDAVRAALLSFAERTGDAIASLELEMQRVVEWVEHDRPRHWKNQNRIASDELTAAKAALSRCLMFPKTVSDRPACYEERQAVKQAQARLDYCERKAERVRHWMRVLPHELSEYKGRISRLKRLVEYEIPQAVGVLNTLLRRLEEYNAVRVEPSQSAYNDAALVRELWPENAGSETIADSTPAAEDATAVEPVESPSAAPPTAGESRDAAENGSKAVEE
jgi:hypothetical protein